MPVGNRIHFKAEALAYERDAANVVYEFARVHRLRKYTEGEFTSSEIVEGRIHPIIIMLPAGMADETTSRIMTDIGRRLRAARIAVGQRNLAALCREVGVAPSRWTNWESSLKMPDPLVLIRFANRFRVSLDYILRGEKGQLPYDLAEAIIAAEREVEEFYSQPRPNARGRLRIIPKTGTMQQ